MNDLEKQSMKSVGNIIILVLTLLFCALDIFCYLYLYEINILYIVLYTVLNVLLMIGIVIFYAFKLKSWFKMVFLCAIFTFIVSWCYYIIVACGWADIFSSKEALQDVIASTGAWGMLVYTVLQFLQVTFIPLPAMLTTIVGTIMFGPLLASLLSLVGIMSGSIFAFWLGDRFGEKLVIWIAGKEDTEKYSKLLYEKGKYLFFLMMLFPLFPDDLLCLVAGLTAMPFRYFLFTIILTRPIGIFMTCYLGSGEIIPYEGWGLVVWALIVILMITLFICSYKYQAQIEKFMTKLSSKLQRKNKKIKPVVTDNEVNEDEVESLYLNAPKENQNFGLPVVIEQESKKDEEKVEKIESPPNENENDAKK